VGGTGAICAKFLTKAFATLCEEVGLASLFFYCDAPISRIVVWPHSKRLTIPTDQATVQSGNIDDLQAGLMFERNLEPLASRGLQPVS
jgi:hypothetical protein